MRACEFKAYEFLSKDYMTFWFYPGGGACDLH